MPEISCRYAVCSFFLLFSLILFPASAAFSKNLPSTSLDFHEIRLGSAKNTVLIVGGIQGDEPGGFSAATLISTSYDILDGSVIVVPNLNFPSIIKRSRGLYGDMNRKFANLDLADPEYAVVKRIQEIIRHPSVRMVLNLHDGSGFYRETYQDKLRNPKKWGQSIIIDQEEMHSGVPLGKLYEQAVRAADKANSQLLDTGHAVHIRNTRTAEGDREMEKSLSYFAVLNDKPAFGLEASKEFPVEKRAYYHLLMIEEFLAMAGVKFKRNFELTPAGIARELGNCLSVTFNDSKIYLPLENVRPAINFLPLPAENLQRAILAKPIMAALPCSDNSKQLCIHFGNRLITHINPEWLETDSSIEGVTVNIDGKSRFVCFGQIVDVMKKVSIQKLQGYRVNAIGIEKGLQDESDMTFGRKDFEKRFSIDKNGSIYRIEIYRDKKFAGMFLVRFSEKKEAVSDKMLPSVKGEESNLGF